MDPNANLRRQLFLANKILDDNNEELYPGGEIDVCDATELAELVVALDEWLKKGGFLPSDWRSSIKSTKQATKGER